MIMPSFLWILFNNNFLHTSFPGKAAPPWDTHSIDWVPTLNLGHQKFDAAAAAKKRTERFQRVRHRKTRQLQVRCSSYCVLKNEGRTSNILNRDHPFITYT